MAGFYSLQAHPTKTKLIFLMVVLVVLYFIYKQFDTLGKWSLGSHSSSANYFPEGKAATVMSLLQSKANHISSKQPLTSSEIFEAFNVEYRLSLAQVPHLPHNLSGTVQSGPPFPTNAIIDSKRSDTLPVKKLLRWTSVFSQVLYMPETVCKTENFLCISTHKKEELLTSDAVIFHSRDLIGLPQSRLPNQRWIYFNMESPMNSGINFRDYNRVFNWTVTYMRDADFSAAYYRKGLRDKPLSNAEYSELFSSILHKKSGLVAARISNCDTHTSDRIRFVRELQHYIPVDFYGACGDLQCPKGKPECEDMSRYKFFLSFENSNCRDYITEKVRLPLHVWDAVPIVMGGSHPDDYLNTLPPNSYIHVNGFSSVKRLAQYLIFLDQNSQFYEKYHLWRKTYKEGTHNTWCDVCQALHNDSMPAKMYSDFGRWYEVNGCVNGCESIELCCIRLITVVWFVTVYCAL